MKQKKYTKRALCMSVLSLLLCVSMLVGTTFAWFTDSVTSGHNRIVAGSLDLVLEMWDQSKNGGEGAWVDAEGKELGFLKPDGTIASSEDILFEPGCTFLTPKFRVRNEGSVATYIILRLDGIVGDEKLMEALEFKTIVGENATIYEGGVPHDWSGEYDIIWDTKDGNVAFDWSLVGKGQESPNTHHKDTSPDFQIKIHMKEDAGNEYQSLAMEGITVSVVGTQSSYEFDSFGKDYDAGAEALLPVTTPLGFTEALKDVSAGEHVDMQLGSDITFTTRDGVELANGSDVSINGEGHTLTVEHTAFNHNDVLEGINSGTLNFKNIVFKGTEGDRNGKFAAVLGFDSDVTIVFENCIFENLYSAVCANPSKEGHSSNIVFKNCTFEDTNYGVSIDPSTVDGSYTVTFDGCHGSVEKYSEFNNSYQVNGGDLTATVVG